MGIQINGNTNNINAGIGSLSIEDLNELDIVGVATAANFKTGVSNLHNLGLTLSGGQLDVGSNIKIGTAGVITATSFVGSGANLTGLNSDLVADTSPQLGGHLDVNDFQIKNGNQIYEIVNNARHRFYSAGNQIIDINGNGVDFLHGNNTHADNVKSQFGASNDLQLYHDGNNSFIDENGDGNLRIRTVNGNGIELIYSSGTLSLKTHYNGGVDLHHTGNKKLETTSSGVTVTGDVTATGLIKTDTAGEGLHNTATNAYFFSHGSNETRLYHSANNQIKLSFRGSGDVLRGAVSADASGMHILTAGSSEQKGIRCITDGTTELYYSGNKKLETTNTGAVVTGICTATSFSGSGENLTRTTQLSHRNLIINGAMQVAQRGTSSTTSGMKTVDRWTNNWSGGGVTQSQVSEQTGTVFQNGFSNYLRLTNTSNTTTDTDYRFIGQTIEAQNVANSGWNFKSSSSYVTLTAWVRSSLAGTYYGWLNSRDGTGQTYTFSYTLSANTWTKITKTIPGNSNITIHDNNEEGLVVHFIPWYGTYYSTSGHTLNTWITQSSTNRCPDFGQNWANTSNATFDVTGVQLEVGEQATPFEHRTYADEFRRCARYCYQWIDDQQLGFGQVYSGSGYTKIFPPIPVNMRAKPSVTKNAPTGYWFVSYHGNSGYAGDRNVSVEGNSGDNNHQSANSFRIFVHGGSNQGNATTVWCLIHDTAGAYLRLEAEI